MATPSTPLPDPTPGYDTFPPLPETPEGDLGAAVPVGESDDPRFVEPNPNTDLPPADETI